MSISLIKKDIEDLHKKPLKTAAEKWKHVETIAITIFATALIMGCSIFAKDLIEGAVHIKLPFEVGK